MIDSQRGAQRRVGYKHHVSNGREWNNCSIKNNYEKLLNLADLVIFFPRRLLLPYWWGMVLTTLSSESVFHNSRYTDLIHHVTSLSSAYDFEY